MKKIKQMMLIGALAISSAVMAQEKEPVFQKQGELIKGTFYYEDGNIRQEGTYKDGELHGEWVSYNKEGEKTAIGQYQSGEKIGKWFFWTEDNLTEVDYENSRIASVNSWKNEKGFVSND